MLTATLDLEHWDTEQVGIVIECQTGIRWTNLAGGTACAYPEAEGIFLPLPTWIAESSLEILRDRWHVETKHVAKFLAAEKLADVLEPAHSAGVGGEAWVPVRIKALTEDAPEWARNLRPFAGRLGFLVYLNSD